MNSPADVEELWLPSALIQWSPRKNSGNSNSSGSSEDEEAAVAAAAAARAKARRSRGRRHPRRRCNPSPQEDVDERSTTVQAPLWSDGAGDRAVSAAPRLALRPPSYCVNFTLPGEPLREIDISGTTGPGDTEPAAPPRGKAGAARILGDPEDPTSLIVTRVLHRPVAQGQQRALAFPERLPLPLPPPLLPPQLSSRPRARPLFAEATEAPAQPLPLK